MHIPFLTDDPNDTPFPYFWGPIEAAEVDIGGGSGAEVQGVCGAGPWRWGTAAREPKIRLWFTSFSAKIVLSFLRKSFATWFYGHGCPAPRRRGAGQ